MGPAVLGDWRPLVTQLSRPTTGQVEVVTHTLAQGIGVLVRAFLLLGFAFVEPRQEYA